MSRVPRIRFKGFEEDWEQRKLEYYLEVSEERNLSNDYTKENVLSVSGDVGIVNQIEFQGRSFAGMLVNNYGVVKTGYVVYTKSPLKNNPYGIIKANKGRDGIVSTLYAIYKPKLNVNSNFIQIYFEQNARMNNYMQPLVNKGAKNDMKISSGNALKGNVIFPIRKEQDIIVDFFFKIDHLITLHQRKLEKLKIIKKSMLENLFPQNGEKTPKIRFSGFTKDWEQRKLGEIGMIITGSTPSTSLKYYYTDDSDEGIVWVTPTDIINNITVESEKRLTSLGQKVAHIVPPNTILVTCIASIGKNTMLIDRGSFNQQINGLIPYKNKYEPYFLLTESFIWSNKMKSLAPAGTIQIVNRKEFSEIDADIPNKSEQNSVGSFFRTLNHLITLHQSKLEKLQKIKKSMLESMFV